MIEFENIDLKFKEKIIFQNFNYYFSQAKKHGIKGESGKGKTTLLNLLMGFIFPQNGSILIDGIALNHQNLIKLRSKIAYLPQNVILLSGNNVMDAILYPFNFARNKKNTPTKKSIIHEFEKVNLNEMILNSNIEKISGGEKQRIGLVITKLLKKDIILLDEPTSALDDISKKAVIEYILNGSETVISVSHDTNWLDNCNEILSL